MKSMFFNNPLGRLALTSPLSLFPIIGLARHGSHFLLRPFSDIVPPGIAVGPASQAGLKLFPVKSGHPVRQGHHPADIS